MFYDILKCFFGYRKENREYKNNSGISYKNSPNGVDMLDSPKEVSIHVRVENLENTIVDSVDSLVKKINSSNQKLTRKINILDNEYNRMDEGIKDALRAIEDNFKELDKENNNLKEKIKTLEKSNSKLRADIHSINQRYLHLEDKITKYLDASSLGVWDKIE